MDRIEYGLLLVRQEEIGNEIAEVRQCLALYANMIREFADVIEKRPEFVGFVEVPLDCIEQEVDVVRSVADSDQEFDVAKTKFDWGSIDIRNIAPKIINLNNLLNDLISVSDQIDNVRKMG